MLSPSSLVKKKNRTHRLVVDYRRLKSQIETSWPLPIICDVIDSLDANKFFSNLNLLHETYGNFGYVKIFQRFKELNKSLTELKRADICKIGLVDVKSVESKRNLERNKCIHFSNGSPAIQFGRYDWISWTFNRI